MKTEKNVQNATKPAANAKSKSKAKTKKIIKWIVIGVLLAGIIVAAVLLIPKLLNKEETASTRITTYNVEEIT